MNFNPFHEEELRAMCGHVEDGSQSTIVIYQDDATHDWVVQVNGKPYYGKTMREALRQANQTADGSNTGYFARTEEDAKLREVVIPPEYTMAEAEKAIIRTRMVVLDFSKPKVAISLGMSLKTLYNKLRLYNV